MDAGDSTVAGRLAFPVGLGQHMTSLGRWMKLVGIMQVVFSGFLLLFAAISFISFVGSGAVAVSVATAIFGVMMALCFRQAILYLAASDHFMDTAIEPEEAHEHLVLAFQRLKPVFVIDAVVAVFLMLHGAMEWII